MQKNRNEENIKISRHAQELVPCQVILVPEAKGKTNNTDPIFLENIS